MIPFTGTASVEAVETYIQSGRVVLGEKSSLGQKLKHRATAVTTAYYGVETLSAVLAIDRLIWARWAKLYGDLVACRFG